MTRRIKIHHIISITLLLGSALYGALLQTTCFVKLGQAIVSLGKSVVYYFASIFGLTPPFKPTAGELPPTVDITVIPSTPSEFGDRWGRFCDLFFDMRNFQSYGYMLAYGITNTLYILLTIIPFIAAIYILFTMSSKTIKVGPLTDSAPLRLFKKITQKAVNPTVREIKLYAEFVKAHKPYYIIAAVIWIISLNLATIGVGFFAFYFYFASSFDFVSIYTNIVRLLSDLKPFFSFLPWWAYIAIAWIVFNRIRKKIAMQRLRHMEMRNRGFLNSLPVAVMLCGTMGKGKTAMLTDMTLSRQATFRDKAREQLTAYQMQFTDFPWLNFERDIISAVNSGGVFNLATCRRFVKSKAKKFERKRKKQYYCWGYDPVKYASAYDNKLEVKDLWHALETYAQLYFIYIVTSSIIASNYSIRDDSMIVYNGNFPMWNSDFLDRDSRIIDRMSRYSHILDFDAMRLIKQVKANNPHTGSLEFGVLAITEVGKERGNQKDTQGVVKMSDREANRLNDGFNRWVKMCRHAATVEFFPYMSIYMDDQRPQSLNADAKELCALVHILDCGEQNIAIPFFWFGGWLYKKLYGWLTEKYLSHRFRRSDRTLTSYAVHKLAAALYKHYTRLYNLYGYKIQRVGVEDGSQDGQVEEGAYFLVNKKIYAKRYDTACFADVFAAAACKTKGGVNTYPEYATVRASWSELLEQHSYFVNEINMDGSK